MANFYKVKYATATWYKPDCKAGLITLGDLTTPTVNPVFVELPVAHRVKPTNLLTSLTSLGLQSSLWYSPRTETAFMSPSGTWCGKYEVGSYLGCRKAYPDTNTRIFVTPNWALALRNKIQDDKVSFADNIGEWRESVKLAEDAAGMFKRAWKTTKTLWRLRKNRRAMYWWFRKGFGRDPANKFELKDAYQVDLLLQFGIKPLCDQAYDSAQQLNRILALKRRLQVTLTSENRVRKMGTFGGEFLTINRRSVRAIAYVTYDSNSREFTAGNLGEALWAGTRLSYLVDWWWNFGSYLSSFNAMNGVTSCRGVACIRDTSTGQDKRRTLSASATVRPGKVVYKAYQRTAFTSIPLPSLPSFRPPETDLFGRLRTTIEVFLSIRNANQ